LSKWVTKVVNTSAFLLINGEIQIRNQAHKDFLPNVTPPNPFSYGSWRHNFLEVLCRPAGFSWLDGPAPVTEDKRRVNPGLEDAGPVWDVMEPRNE